MGDFDNMTPMKLVNEDGTEVNIPENPLKEKWDRLYPPMRFGRPCAQSYECVLCREKKCPHSEGFQIPEEDKVEFEEYENQVREYFREHNPKLYGKE